MRFVVWIIGAVVLTGCATPAERFRAQASALGFIESVVHSDPFDHRLFYNGKTGQQWHIYLDGDGTPWVRQRWVAEDPTARNPLILDLMSQDSAPAILLGRPCYYGLQNSSHCQSKYWTSHRYSQEVINSITLALQQLRVQYQIEHWVLIGYSGGGAIAALTAGHITSLDTLVTVAANLNVKDWSEFHGYETFSDSLDPIKNALINPTIRQFHFAGANDKNVPAAVIESFVNTQSNVRFHEWEGVDHAGWNLVWENILKMIVED